MSDTSFFFDGGPWMAMEPLEAESLEDGPLEKGSLESGTVPGEPPADQGSTLPGGPFPGAR